MGQTEITIFVILVNLVLLILIAGIIIFVLQFRQRKKQYEQEMKMVDEQHTRELLNTRLEIQHQTMQHIGSEIHDSVGQKLTLAFLYTNQLTADQFPEQAEKIKAIGNIINESLEELRSLSKTLNNPALAHADLMDLLKNEAEQINTAGVCRIILHSTVQSIDIPLSEKNIVFRILQEFIQNSLKHARCKRICIDINMDAVKNELHIHAADDGKGFVLGNAPHGIGLSNMHRRAAQIGADFHLQSEPGNGTSLRLILAIKKKNTT